jgi:hypothetical protein
MAAVVCSHPFLAEVAEAVVAAAETVANPITPGSCAATG